MTPASSRQQFTAGALAVLVHALFFASLVVGMSWKTLPQLPVYADLWTALPEPPPPPEPEPVAEPEPAPPPEEVAPPPKPDIVLEQEKKKRLEEKRRLEAEAKQRKADEEKNRQAEAKRQEELKRLEEAKRKEEAKKLAEAKRQEELKRKEEVRKEMDRALAEEMAADLADERSRLDQARQQAAVRGKMVAEFRDRIMLKIRGLLRLPPALKGNPEAVFQVRLLPNGEVLRAVLVKSSGQPAYDQEVERAILKASPLPLPPDKDAAAVFRDGLTLKFRPSEGG